VRVPVGEATSVHDEWAGGGGRGVVTALGEQTADPCLDACSTRFCLAHPSGEGVTQAASPVVE
jgi:hypothetical protein